MTTENNQKIAAQAFADMRAAFKNLQQSTIKQRLTALGLLRDYIVNKREDIVVALINECGKTRTDANIEFIGAIDWLRWLENHAYKYLKDSKMPTPLLLLGKKSKIIHEPLGAILIIAPWNYPFHIGITQIFTAFACGNTVVYKPSEITPMRGIYEELFAAVPIISESVRVVYGNGELGRELIEQQPEKIFFTGSTRTGTAISKQAADYLIPVDLELGGKDPMIVFDSANIKRAVAAAVWGAFTHNGQSCSAVERLYVQAGIYDEFTAKLKEETLKLVMSPQDRDGNVDLGHITVDFQYDIVKKHVQDAIDKGATVLTGGREISRETLSYEPTILLNVSKEMLAVSHETFGPVMPVIKFETEAEAIELANDSEFGLQGSVFSADMQQCDRVMRALEVGGVSINNVNLVEGNPWLSFGGRKKTGTGRARGIEGLHAFTRSKHVLIDPNSAQIDPNWYPYTTTKYQMMLVFIKHLFSRAPLATLRMAISGLKLQSQSQKPRR